MRVALLSGQNSIHTVRWANALAEHGVEVHLLTQHTGGDVLRGDVAVHSLRAKGSPGYYANVFELQHRLRQIRPDLLNAHYASGYGTLARLSGFRPLLLSVWGSDVYDFPQRSFWHRRLLRKNLLAADRVASTSQCMARQTLSIAPELSPLSITPFGVDLRKFRPLPAAQSDVITLGTVKTLLPKYGIDILIRGFAHCRELLRSQPRRLQLRIVGGGAQHDELVALTKQLHLTSCVEFVGPVPHARVCAELNRLDIYCAASRLASESFGVAVIEASACERPVIVANIGGLPEVVEHGQTGLLVPPEDPASLGRAMCRLVNDAALRRSLGQAGRQLVEERYDWNHNVRQMIQLYEEVIRGAERQTLRQSA